MVVLHLKLWELGIVGIGGILGQLQCGESMEEQGESVGQGARGAADGAGQEGIKTREGVLC